MTKSIMCIIHIICQYIYGIYLAYAWHIPTGSIYLTYALYTTSTKYWGSSRYPIYMAYTYLMKVYVICIQYIWGNVMTPIFFVEVIYKEYLRYTELVVICQAYIVICLAYTWNILFSQKLELEYIRNLPDTYLTKSGIFHIPGGWSVSWCWKEKWRVNVHAAQLHDSWVSSISWHNHNNFFIIHCMLTRTLVYIITSCHTYHCTNVPWLIIQL